MNSRVAEMGYIYRGGFLPAGDDLSHLNGRMSEAAAMALCAAHKACAGFTYNSGDRGRARGEEEVLFKSLAENVAVAPGWHTVRKRADSGVDCRPGLRPPAPPPITFNVKVLREEPPVFQVDGFVSEKLCQAMVNSTVPKMGRSVVSGGGFSSARRSYSVNMYPEFDDPSMPVTQVARALFSFAREVAGYDTLKEGPGQEPVNAVFYQVRRTRYPRRALPEGSHFCSVCRQAKGAPCESSRLWPCSCCTAPRIALRRPIPQPLRWRV
mmetsp:Transcript_10133/g.31080  ORF Transcript_10133/g.31080 Transcript_10133/m.31080 type:complete len:267 (-) Transcript_10133:473-1273(-)